MSDRAVTLRLARPADAAAMAAMSRDFIEAGLAWRYSPARIARLIAHREVSSLVADDGSGPQGFAIMEFGDERAHLVLLCVQPALRRRGLGRHMIEWMLRSAQVAGMASIRLELRADNLGAQSFYAALGFEEEGLVPGYYDGRVAARRMIRRTAPGT
jgi:ribosomal protein S18 acetylase RimI-like enzyme